MDRADELQLRHAGVLAALRRDPGEQAGLRIGQVVGVRLAVQRGRPADDVQFHVQAQTGELDGPVADRIGPGGLIIVGQQTVHVGFAGLGSGVDDLVQRISAMAAARRTGRCGEGAERLLSLSAVRGL